MTLFEHNYIICTSKHIVCVTFGILVYNPKMSSFHFVLSKNNALSHSLQNNLLFTFNNKILFLAFNNNIGISNYCINGNKNVSFEN